MKRINLRMTAGLALVASAMFAVVMPAETSQSVSADEARQVTGGQSGAPCFVGAWGGTGCWSSFLGLKFWEGCTQAPYYGVNTAYSGNDCLTTITCFTTCGYLCGAYNTRVNCAAWISSISTTATSND